MSNYWPQVILVFSLIVVNGILAGSEAACISLREGQLREFERRGKRGSVSSSVWRASRTAFSRQSNSVSRWPASSFGHRGSYAGRAVGRLAVLSR